MPWANLFFSYLKGFRLIEYLCFSQRNISDSSNIWHYLTIPAVALALNNWGKLHTYHNTYKYLLKQWIALKKRSVWLLKLWIASAIHLQAICAGFAYENVVFVAGIHQLKSYFVLHRLTVSVHSKTSRWLAVDTTSLCTTVNIHHYD